MSKILKLILILILLAGWVVAAASMYVIVYPPYLIGIVPKDRMSFKDSFVSTQNWTVEDLARHPELVKRVISAGKSNWLEHIAKSGEIPNILEKSPASTQSTTHPTLPVRNLGIK